jgi:hypothetical protein
MAFYGSALPIGPLFILGAILSSWVLEARKIGLKGRRLSKFERSERGSEVRRFYGFFCAMARTNNF